MFLDLGGIHGAWAPDIIWYPKDLDSDSRQFHSLILLGILYSGLEPFQATGNYRHVSWNP